MSRLPTFPPLHRHSNPRSARTDFGSQNHKRPYLFGPFIGYGSSRCQRKIYWERKKELSRTNRDATRCFAYPMEDLAGPVRPHEWPNCIFLFHWSGIDKKKRKYRYLYRSNKRMEKYFFGGEHKIIGITGCADVVNTMFTLVVNCRWDDWLLCLFRRLTQQMFSSGSSGLHTLWLPSFFYLLFSHFSQQRQDLPRATVISWRRLLAGWDEENWRTCFLSF